MWSRKSHHEDIRKLQWCSCRCCTNDPVLKLQMNGSREKQCKPKLNTDSKNSDGKKSCVLCKDSVTSPQVTMKFVNSVASREEKITHRDNNSNHQNAVDIECDKESSKYDDDFDQRAVSIYYFNNHESRVFECLLHWCFIQSMWAVKAVRSQRRLTPGLWYRECQSPYFQRSVSPRRTRISAMPYPQYVRSRCSELWISRSPAITSLPWQSLIFGLEFCKEFKRTRAYSKTYPWSLIKNRPYISPKNWQST